MPEDETKYEIVPNPWSWAVVGSLRSLGASFPVFASAVQVWNEYETDRTSRRIQELFRSLATEFKAMELKLSEHGEALKLCQDFPELLEITIDKVRKEYGESKRATYARVLARLLISGDECGYDERIELLESLDSLSEMDLRVLKLFFRKEEATIDDLQWRPLRLPGSDPSNQLWQLSCHLAKLESRGLILKGSQGPGVIYVRDGMTSAASRSLETKYRLLPAGARLIDALL